MFDPHYDITQVKPASYNPRLISEEKILLLRESLRTIGVLKPIIVRSDRTIIAGHQRTKSMLTEGYTHAPAYIIDGITKTDEVRFNQMHNGADQEIKSTTDYVTVTGVKPGWNTISYQDITIHKTGNNAMYKKEISRLLLKYGAWGNSICDQDGVVFVSTDYASVCKLLHIDLLIYQASADQVPLISHYFGHEYGTFHYDHLEKNTYVQTLAQMNRLEGNKQFKSTLYENDVIPTIKKTDRILDFGAGRQAYVRKLAKAGYNIRGLEFYTRKKDVNAIDVTYVNKVISEIIADVLTNGLYDVVICDSVLNSVDSIEAEQSVIHTLQAFCKPSGVIMVSGRRREFIDYVTTTKHTSDARRNTIYFIDSSGFTANFRSGHWFYQRFHTDKEVTALAAYLSCGKPDSVRLHGGSWQVRARNAKRLSETEFDNALKFEFSLPLPNGRRYDRSAEVISALAKFHRFELVG